MVEIEEVRAPPTWKEHIYREIVKPIIDYVELSIIVGTILGILGLLYKFFTGTL